MLVGANSMMENGNIAVNIYFIFESFLSNFIFKQVKGYN